MSTKSKRARRKSSDELVVRLGDLHAENEKDFRIRDAANARITARNKLIEAAAALEKLTPRKARSKPPVFQSKTAKAVEVAKDDIARAVRAFIAPHHNGDRTNTGSVGIVLEVLRAHPQGIGAPELKRKAGEHPEASKSIKEHGQYIYSVLDTLQRRGHAVRGDDGKWKPIAPPSAGAH